MNEIFGNCIIVLSLYTNLCFFVGLCGVALKYKYGNRHFWCHGYFVDTVGRNETVIKKYIQNQLKEDYEYDQMTLKEYVDPFTGSKN